MLFCTPVFFFFFVAYFLIWSVSPKKWRLWIIIGGSLFFYGYWNWHYVVIPIGLTAVSYFGGNLITAEKNPKRRKIRLIVSVIFLLVPLFIFKYLNFFAGRKIITAELPIGISFITFTLIAYLIDIARGDYPKEKKFSWLLAYITYFPQLIAGPILRPSELLPQLKKDISVSWKIRREGLIFFTIGLAKKLIIADQLKPFVDHIYEMTSINNMVDFFLAFYAFPVQIYCDFSGYSDMAIGLALVFGITLPINFNRPFCATSTTEVWRRWHITLSYWFRDYVYFPMTGKTAPIAKKVFGKVFSMLLCGFWHGANWTFIVWGSLNGFLLSIEYLFKKAGLKNHLPKFVKIIITFHFFAIGVVFVRAESIWKALSILTSFTTWNATDFSVINSYVFPIVIMLLFFILHPFDNMDIVKKVSGKMHAIPLTFIIITIWIIAIVLSATGGGISKFIYFDF